MYTPEHFRETDPAALLALMRRHPFAVLAAADGASVEATHVPVVADADEAGAPRAVRFHLAAANPLCDLLGNGAEALIAFTGPHAYVSPDWYESPDQVPTWNYVAVHVRGRATALDETALRALLAELAAAGEATLPKPPWRPERVDAGRYAAMLRAIRGFRVAVEHVTGKRKLNQNRTAADRAGVVAALEALGDEASRAVAEEMRRADERGG